MVSFSCESCGDVLTKKKLDPHRNRCHGATYTCIDCMVYFPGTTYRSHTSCISEAQKYQGALYKNKKGKNAQSQPAPAQDMNMSHKPYVEDVPDDVPEDYREYEDDSDDDNRSPIEPLPEAPTPPPAPEVVNVFDFLVASNTPNASTVNLAHPNGLHEDNQLVRYDYEADGYGDPTECVLDGDELIQYGTGPIAAGPFQTPAPKVPRKKSEKGSEVKTDKKRKRLHIETDQVMTDAPPVLHSGLTGGLNRLMKPVFPPSPDYSGGDAGPASPVKKSKKSSKASRHESGSGIGNNLLAMMTTKASKTTKTSKTKKTKSAKKHKSRHEKSSKLIEYRPQSRDSKKGGSDNGNQMVVFKPRADLFLSFVNKGPGSERGCSLNKALKRYHRERANSSEEGVSKGAEEKELFRSLRMRKNDRGEIVLFTI